MKATLINQFPGRESTAERLQDVLSSFASHEKAQLRALVAFASAAGLQLIERELRTFLDNKNPIYWIVGVDLGGTGREALEFLLDLRRRYPGLVDARVFTTGTNINVFHPKVYWLDAIEKKTVILGSANATKGGLDRNFEVSVQLDIDPDDDDELVEDFDGLWMSYSTPLPPLTSRNLVSIDKGVVAKLAADSPPTDPAPQRPHPFADVATPIKKKPAKGAVASSGRRTAVSPTRAAGGRELIMDILQETRGTQVQLPVESVDAFFRTQTDTIELRQIAMGRVVKVDSRPLIHLDNATHRIELDAIRGLPRPQIARFFRPSQGGNVIEYEIVLRGTKEFREIDRTLQADGRRTRSGARRWLIR